VSLKVALRPGSGVRVGELTERMRGKLPDRLRGWLKDRWREEGVPADKLDTRAEGLRLSFEPGDLVNEVMSFGSPNAVEVQVSGPNFAANAGYAKALAEKFRSVPELRDVQIAQARDYPTLEVRVDREKTATAGLTVRDVGVGLIPATSSSRFVSPTYWQDPKNGQSYLIQVQVPPPRMATVTEIGLVPVRGPTGWSLNGNGHTFSAATAGGVSTGSVMLRDVAAIKETTSAESMDRHNMQRMISVTANVGTPDLGGAGRAVRRAIADAGPPPKGTKVDVRGQVESLDSIEDNLRIGLGIAVLAIFLLLTAYYQSIRLALVSVAAIPATLCGVGLALWLTGTTLNLLSFMAAIMAVGVAVANAILLVTFAERGRTLHGAAAEGGAARLRAVLMTSGAMVAGMLPMALGIGEGAEQTAALARAVVGGVLVSTAATLFALPTVFALVQ
jgi:multidrug efflux pump subunit AcrB